MRQLSVTVRNRVAETEKQYIDYGSSCAELESLFQRYLTETETKIDDAKNGTGKRRRAGRHTALFLSKFQDYVNAYSGIVQVMNGAGPGYGDAAYGALSLFLVVGLYSVQTRLYSCCQGRCEPAEDRGCHPQNACEAPRGVLQNPDVEGGARIKPNEKARGRCLQTRNRILVRGCAILFDWFSSEILLYLSSPSQH
jgi:hypothetical protein